MNLKRPVVFSFVPKKAFSFVPKKRAFVPKKRAFVPKKRMTTAADIHLYSLTSRSRTGAPA